MRSGRQRQGLATALAIGTTLIAESAHRSDSGGSGISSAGSSNGSSGTGNRNRQQLAATGSSWQQQAAARSGMQAPQASPAAHLRQKGFKHVDQVEHGAPRLVDHVQAHAARALRQ